MQLWFVSRVTQNCVTSHMCWVSLGLGTALPDTDCQEEMGPWVWVGWVWFSAFPGLSSPHTCLFWVCVPMRSHWSLVCLGDVVPGLTAPEDA